MTITFRPIGGLGNQLFVYAAASSLALRNQTDVQADLSFFEGNLDRKYELNTFASNIHSSFLGPKSGAPRADRLWWRSIQSKLTPRDETEVFQERGFWFDERILSVRQNVTLSGYFQSWKYFADHQSGLRAELKNVTNPTPWFLENFETLSNAAPWAAVHVRRGDYRTVHGMRTTSAAYYERALGLLGKLVGELDLVVFSDDFSDSIPAIENHNSGNVRLISPPPDSNPIESLNLMSLADHIVIANSTFSWWAAWLGQEKGRYVIHPRPWVDFKSVNDRDLHLPSWIGIGRDDERSAMAMNVVN